jgi:hypothetical protein
MRMVLGALALAASIVPSAGPAPQVQTLYVSSPHHSIGAFAQDGGVVSWFEPDAKNCNLVYVLQVADGVKFRLPAQGASYRNVTCRWEVRAGSPVWLAVAADAGSPSVLWALHESASQALQFDYVLGAAVSNPNERRFQEVAHAQRGAGLWLGGVAGDAGTLVYAVAGIDYKDEIKCLSTPSTPGACDMTVTGGGVYLVVGRKQPTLVKGTSAAVAVAVSGSDVALVRAATASVPDGRPLASADLPIEVRDVGSGSLLASVTPAGTPLAIALSSRALALLEQTPSGPTLAWFDPTSGAPLGSVSVPAATAPALSASGGLIVFRVDRSIRAVDIDTQRVRILAKAGATPIGLSIDGGRIAWAENVGGRGRIRSVTVP